MQNATILRPLCYLINILVFFLQQLKIIIKLIILYIFFLFEFLT